MKSEKSSALVNSQYKENRKKQIYSSADLKLDVGHAQDNSKSGVYLLVL